MKSECRVTPEARAQVRHGQQAERVSSNTGSRSWNECRVTPEKVPSGRFLPVGHRLCQTLAPGCVRTNRVGEIHRIARVHKLGKKPCNDFRKDTRRQQERGGTGRFRGTCRRPTALIRLTATGILMLTESSILSTLPGIPLALAQSLALKNTVRILAELLPADIARIRMEGTTAALTPRQLAGHGNAFYQKLPLPARTSCP